MSSGCNDFIWFPILSLIFSLTHYLYQWYFLPLSIINYHLYNSQWHLAKWLVPNYMWPKKDWTHVLIVERYGLPMHMTNWRQLNLSNNLEFTIIVEIHVQLIYHHYSHIIMTRWLHKSLYYHLLILFRTLKKMYCSIQGKTIIILKRVVLFKINLTI